VPVSARLIHTTSLWRADVADDLTSTIAERLTARRDDVLAAWRQVRTMASSSRSIAELDGELVRIYDSLVAALRLGDADIRSTAFDEARALLAELSTTRARQGYTPTETAATVFALKDAVASTGTLDQLAPFAALSQIVDKLGLFTFETFAAARERVINNQAEQLLELSTPVIKLWDGVLAVPLVGTLDSARTQVVMETLLQALVDTGSAHAIIDITGVAAVDTQVAQHLLKTVVAARLMGAECIISGIRPQIAQTVVALGIEFGDIPTKATLADALREVLGRAGMDLRVRSRPT
jgi:rsbT co-antagonist protein RsbR